MAQPEPQGQDKTRTDPPQAGRQSPRNDQADSTAPDKHARRQPEDEADANRGLLDADDEDTDTESDEGVITGSDNDGTYEDPDQE